MNEFLLDEKDKKILFALDFEPKISLKRLAKKVSVNRNTLEYRLERLSKNKVLLNFYPLVNGFNLGVSYYKFFIKVRKKPENYSLNALFKEPEVVWIAETDGSWDLVFGLKVSSVNELSSFINKLNSLFDSEKKLLLIITRGFFFNERWLTEKPDFKEIILEHSHTEELSLLDKRIIDYLFLDARDSTVALAQKLKVSPETIRQRVKKLEEKKVITGYKTRLNYEALGFDYYHILISLRNKKFGKKVTGFLKNVKTTLAILEFIGPYDIQAEIIAKKYSEIRNIVEQLSEKFPEEIEEIVKLNIVNQSSTKTA